MIALSWSGQSSGTPTSGRWLRHDGATVEVPCPKKYGDVTILGEGCRLTLAGGGLLYTRSADASVFSEMEMASEMISGLKSEIKRLHLDMESLKKSHLLKIAALSEQSKLDIKMIVKENKRQSIRDSITVGLIGAAVGALLMAAVL